MPKFANEIYQQMSPFILTASIAGNGWQGDPFGWTYVGSTSFSVAGNAATVDVTGQYPPGLKLAWDDSGSLKYGVVGSAAFGTVTTVYLIPTPDYTFNGSAITRPFTSRIAYPDGWPVWFNWNPTLTGWSAAPTTKSYRYQVNGRQVTATFAQTTGGTSNGTVAYATLPIPMANSPSRWWGGANNFAYDNGALITVATRWALPSVPGGTNCVDFYTNMGLGGWTATGSKWISAVITYEI
jgi:hypothetical protein